MKIQSAIRDHILNHDFVMLPGIGAFIAEYTKPYFNEAGDIIPSVRNIRFNPELRNDSDVEILQVFKNRMGITDEEVQNQYFSFLDDFEESIRIKGQYYWENLGILSKDDSGKLAFFELSENYFSENKTEINAEVPDSIEINKVIAPEDKVIDNILRKIENGVNDNPVEISKDFLEEDFVFSPPKQKNEGFLKLIIFVLPFLLLGIALSYTVFYKPSVKAPVVEEKKSENVVASSEIVRTDSEVEKTLENEVDKPVEVLNKVVEKEVNQSKKETSSNEEHIVSIGIFRTEKHADDVVTFLAENGYPGRVRKYGKLYKVYLVAKDSDQALQYVDEVGKIKALGVKPLYQR